MVVVKTKKHTIIKCATNSAYAYNNYRVWEYCSIIKMKDEIKHPTGKKKILSEYGFA